MKWTVFQTVLGEEASESRAYVHHDALLDLNLLLLLNKSL
jgi:hypothetical protein